MAETYDWVYQGRPADEIDISEWLGFIYLVTAPNGMKYIGKKQFWSSIKRKPLKGQKRVRRDKKESDWRKYFGSSASLLVEMEKTGPNGWTREILRLCTCKWDLAYFELQEQLACDAIRDPGYWNSILNIRLPVRKTFAPPGK